MSSDRLTHSIHTMLAEQLGVAALALNMKRLAPDVGVRPLAAFNTGRWYGPLGQRIAVYGVLDAAGHPVLVFRDFDRNIMGTVPMAHDPDNRYEIARHVMKFYDAGLHGGVGVGAIRDWLAGMSVHSIGFTSIGL